VPLRAQPAAFAGAALTVVVDPRGMSAFRQQPPAWLQDASPAVLVDPRPYGEWARFRSAWQRNGILLGRGEGYQAAVDIALVCASLPGKAPIRLVALGEAGVPALLAARLCARIVQVANDDLGAPYAEDGNRAPLCPELLRHLDLPDLIASLPAACRFERLRAR
jgi:hypothetical protein